MTAGAQRRRAACIDAARAQRLHEISHRQAGSDVVSRIEFTAWIEGMASILDDLRRQRNVAGDDEIAGVESFHDLIVSNIKPRCDLNRLNQA